MALHGKNNEEKIWNFLKSKGLNDYGAAGLMGNLYAESGLNPCNLQNTYERSLGFTDAEYTAAVDSGKYSGFVRDCGGYGLAQWTHWSRKEALLKHVKACGASIGDLEAQLEYLFIELGRSFASVLRTLKTAQSVREASDVVLLKFERPADQSEAAKARRASYGQKYYDRYARTAQQITPGTPSFKVGDVVEFTGNKNYLSANGIAAKSCKGGKAKITQIYMPGKSRHPYHLVKVSGSGATVHGWVDAANIAKISETEVPAKSWTPKVGDTVIYNGTVNYTSANGTTPKACKGGKAKITQIYMPGKSRHPYHLVRVSGSGATVHGWVNAGTFTKA
jgi:hypothetical protein